MFNQITSAFMRINNLPPMIKGVLAKNITNQIRRSGKGFSTKLSFKTYQKLKAEGKVE